MATAAVLPSWASKPCAMGIDEAGRGPVLGPMVYGCAYCPLPYLKNLQSMEFADSKTLKESKRDELFEDIKSNSSMGWEVDVIDPRELSAHMLGKNKRNLNTISHDAAKGLITHALKLGVLITEVYVDTVGDADKYREQLSEKFPGIKFTVSKKADSLFPIVSAASIAAKVTRDKVLREWVMDESSIEISREYGSGYPADPETKAWLQKHKNAIFGFPTLVRFSWATCKTIIETGKDSVSVYWEAEESEKESGKSDESKAKRKGCVIGGVQSNAVGRHKYFSSRSLQQVTTRL